jgi:hypothetical protein
MLRFDGGRPAQPATCSAGIWDGGRQRTGDKLPRIRRGASVSTTPGGVRNYDVMPDGRLLVVMPIGDSPPESREIRVMLNWFEELRRR